MLKKVYGHRLYRLLSIIVCLAMPLSAANALPVIPGATGFGIDTPAGRGGEVYRITNLNASGSGSLAECVGAEGPRVCIFEVSGTIRLPSDLNIQNPFLTIAGQTAPSPGITLRDSGLKVATHDVLVQHIRIRVGDHPDGHQPNDRDGLKIMHGNDFVHNVVIDHVSVSWSIDELMSTWADIGDITIRNSIFAEPLEDSLHPSGPHAFGPLLVGGDRARVSMTNSIIAHGRERNPRTATNLFFANNLVYNWQDRGTEIFNRDGNTSRTSIIGNVYKPGPNTGSTLGIVIQPNHGSSNLWILDGTQVYVRDNRGQGYDANNPWAMVDNNAGNNVRTNSPPITVPGFEPMNSQDVEQHVLAAAGARPADRDSVDERITRQIANGEGRIIDSQRDVGGWPTLGQNQVRHTLPDNPNRDSNGNGYTNLEEWLHEMAAQVEGRVTAPRPPTGLLIRSSNDAL